MLAPEPAYVWIPGSRWRLVFLTVVSLGMGLAALAMALLSKTTTSHAVGWFGVVFFGGGSLAIAWRAVKPGGVRLTPEGLAMMFPRTTIFRPWTEFDAFCAVHVGGMNELVGFRLRDDARPQRANRLSRAIFGVDGVLPSQLSVKARDLVLVLERWRNRYGAGAAERS